MTSVLVAIVPTALVLAVMILNRDVQATGDGTTGGRDDNRYDRSKRIIRPILVDSRSTFGIESAYTALATHV